ncbi:MAG: amidohydrolase [Bacteroidales bacterium]|nr:amidohydrolase [Bacteroidales bacterium]
MGKKVLQSVLCNDVISDIVIDGNRFSEIVPSVQGKQYDNAEIIDCSGLAILPAFYNAHTHAAMTLMRGYADDTPLFEWLNDYIWPLEAKLTAKDIEIGSRLAVLEMIKSGTVFFSDMYWHREETMKVVEEMGIRAAIGVTISDVLTSPKGLEENFSFLKQHKGESERVKLVVMPHAIYTNSDECFQRCITIAKGEGYVLHTHLSETSKEVNDCLLQYKCTPVELMEKWGALSSNFVAAHCVHFSEKDKKIFSQSGAMAVVNPCSNLKLGSGIPNIVSLLKHNIMVALGTDGASSNNNLDMREEMKMAGLLTKANDANVIVSKNDILKLATENGAKAYGLQHVGRIEEGWLADCILIRMDNERMVPCHDIVSNWIYGADSRAIDSVMCNGTFVMRNGHVDGEDDIIAEAVACAKRLCS